VREKLNQRLQDGESGRKLIAWLNKDPEVRQVLTTSFEGRPINEQNLTEWKAGGYQDWLAQQEARAQLRELTADTIELAKASDMRLGDHLATLLAARYASVLANWDGETTEGLGGKLRALKGLCKDIADLRRGDHDVTRLALEEERFELKRGKSAEEWAKNPKVKSIVLENQLTPEEKEKRWREILGISDEHPKMRKIREEREAREAKIRPEDL